MPLALQSHPGGNAGKAGNPAFPRTAITKLPSARESRASAARQYRAAAFGEMFCPKFFSAWLMFNTLKVTQAEKQIYPQTFGKVKRLSPAKTGTIRLRQRQELVLRLAPARDAARLSPE